MRQSEVIVKIMNLIMIKKWFFFTFIMTLFIILNLMNCVNSKQLNCGFRKYETSDSDMEFDSVVWNKNFIVLPGVTCFEQPYRDYLVNRERMLCDLIQKLKIIKPTYENVITLLGKSIQKYGTSDPRVCDIADPSFDCKAFNLDEALKSENAIIYEVGFKVEGNNFVVFVFEDGRFAHCFRIFRL